MRRLLAAAAVSITAMSPVLAATVNQISDPGFESGTLGSFMQGRDASNPFFPVEFWNVTSGMAHTGEFAATALGNVELRLDFAPIAVGTITELSFWLRHPNEAVAPANIGLFYADGSEGVAIAITEGTGWEFFDITRDLEPGQLLTGFSVFGYDPGEDARTLLDDVTLLVPAPASLALFGLAAAVLLARTRRRI